MRFGYAYVERKPEFQPGHYKVKLTAKYNNGTPATYTGELDVKMSRQPGGGGWGRPGGAGARPRGGRRGAGGLSARLRLPGPTASPPVSSPA